MKAKILIVLIVFTMTICAPFKLDFHFTRGNKSSPILTLDVCHASATVFSVQADIQYVPECSMSLPFFENSSVYTSANSVLTPLLVALRQDRPPEA